jgi:outer membrane protein assembly factor BamB
VILSRWLLAASLSITLTGCNTVAGLFESSEEDPLAPVELERINETVKLRKAWSLSVGNGQSDGFFKLTPMLNDGVLYAASANGEVFAVRAESGDRLWRVELERPISGGVGYFDNELFFGSADGTVFSLSAEDGSPIWEAEVSGEVLAPPVASANWVIVQTYDGKLLGFERGADAPKWTYTSDVPVLTLRGTSSPMLVNNNAIAGFADGKVVAVDVDSGNASWEARIGVPQGSSEIDRIVDIDGSMTQVGSELFVASYQGRIAVLDSRTGRKAWQQNVSSVSGTQVGFGNVYVADIDGTVSAYLRSGQGLRWQNIELGYRGLSRPTPVNSFIAMVDFDGYLHVMSQVDGQLVGRERVDSSGARADLIAQGSRLYLYTNKGQLVAYDLEVSD